MACVPQAIGEAAAGASPSYRTRTWKTYREVCERGDENLKGGAGSAPDDMAHGWPQPIGRSPQPGSPSDHKAMFFQNPIRKFLVPLALLMASLRSRERARFPHFAGKGRASRSPS